MGSKAPSERRGAWAVFLTALTVRVGYWLWLGRPAALVGDALEYHEFARSLVETGRYLGPHGEAASRMPGYPLFLAALRVVYGGSLNEVILAQCVVGAFTCVLLHQLANRFVPGRWPFVCGLVGAFYLGMIAPSAFPLSECLYSFFLVLSVWALYRPDWKPMTRALSFGALSGCLYLIRPEPLPYIVCTIALMPYMWAKFGRKEVLSGLAVFTLVAGLWVGRNFANFGRIIPASTVGKSVGYLSMYLPAARMGLAGERHQPPPEMNELERDADYAAAWKRLAAALTWPQIVKGYVYNLLSILYPFLPEYDWTYVFIAPFWLFGCWIGARRKELWPVAGAVLCSLSVFTFFGGYASRYRQGVSPFIVLLAVVGMQAAHESWGHARFRLRAGSWLGVNVLLCIFQGPARQAALWLRVAVWGH